MIFLVDIDGTLADASHRVHHITTQEPKDWNAFYAGIPEDKPIFQVITIVRALSKAGHNIHLVTGRPDNTRDITSAWLQKFRIPYGLLLMRKEGDHRKDSEVKSELIDLAFSMISPEDMVAIEDRNQVVEMYRARGIKTLQVAPGNF